MKNKNRIEVKVDEKGYTSTFLDGELHSFNDRPSFVSFSGLEQTWHKNGKLHRDTDKPAHRTVNKTFVDDYLVSIRKDTFYYKNGMFHREVDKPAFMRSSLGGGLRQFETSFYYEDKLHRLGDQPALHKAIYKDGGVVQSWDEQYWVDGFEHRDGDKPAIILQTSELSLHKYFINGKYHRDNGQPAVTVHTEGNVYFSFLEDSLRSVNSKKFFKELVLNDVKTYASGWENISMGECPVEIMNSVLYAATGINYVLDAPHRFLLRWWS